MTVNVRSKLFPAHFSHLFPWLTAPWASGCSFSLWLWSLLFLSFAFGLSPDVHPGPTPFNTSDVSHARVVSAASVCVPKKMRNRRLQVLLEHAPIVPNLSQCCSNVTIDISVSVLFSVDVNPDRHTRSYEYIEYTNGSMDSLSIPNATGIQNHRWITHPWFLLGAASQQVGTIL